VLAFEKLLGLTLIGLFLTALAWKVILQSEFDRSCTCISPRGLYSQRTADIWQVQSQHKSKGETIVNGGVILSNYGGIKFNTG